MAYRANHIEAFINKVKKEAEEAAQAVFDKHNEKLQELVNNQVLPNQKLIVAMGAATIVQPDRELPYLYAEKFLGTIANTQYWSDNISAGFCICDVDKTK